MSDRITGADTHLARDYEVSIINDGEFINRCTYLVGSLAKKAKHGSYDPVLAGRAWRYIVEDYRATYNRNAGSKVPMDVPTRNLAGRLLEAYHRDEVYEVAGLPEPKFVDADAELKTMEVV